MRVGHTDRLFTPLIDALDHAGPLCIVVDDGDRSKLKQRWVYFGVNAGTRWRHSCAPWSAESRRPTPRPAQVSCPAHCRRPSPALCWTAVPGHGLFEESSRPRNSQTMDRLPIREVVETRIPPHNESAGSQRAMNLTQIATALESDDAPTGRTAIRALETNAELHRLPPDVWRRLVRWMGHSDKHIQRAAVGQLARFAPQQPEILERVRRKLSDPNPRVRWTAAFTLSRITPSDVSPLPVLFENLGQQTSDLRWAAAAAVHALAACAPDRVEQEILTLATTGNAVQRRMALYCLRDLDAVHARAQAVYLASLTHPDPLVRLAGLACVGRLTRAGPAIRAALATLLDSDPHPGVRRSTATTCHRLGRPDARLLAALSTAANSQDCSLRKAARRALAAPGLFG